MRERDVFDAALAIADPAERSAYLAKVSAGNPELRQHLEGLLDVHAHLGSFLQAPAPSLTATVDAPGRERPGTMIGPYKLLEQIGEGGFGDVFMAEQLQPVRRKVALKVLKPGMDTRQVVARFEAERQALALMDHPNIARVFDGGEAASGRPYLVMELVRGIPITDFCDHNQLSVRERLALFISVCQAVQHAHQKGIIHRDLKPSNVLVTLHDGTPVVKVIDFGVAKARGQELTDKTLFTGFAQTIGTPLYMSPEQADMSGLDVDTRSDIYSLGVLLYELLTGTTPFDKKRLGTASYDEIRRIICEEDAPRPSTQISTLGQAAATVSANRRSQPQKLGQLMRGELDWIVMKALEKDRNRRYESASAFAADVQRYLHDEPVQACPPSAWYRLGKFARRHKAILGVSGLVLFFLVLIGGGIGAAVRDRAAREADLARDKVARQEKLNLEIEHALEDVARARNQALKLTENASQWKAALAEAASDLKRARGPASQDETALEPAIRERLQTLQTLLDADEADRRFAARFEEIRLDQAEVNVAISVFKSEIAFAAFKESFQRHYRIAFGAMPIEQAATLLRQRPQAMRNVLLAALEICFDHVPKGDPQARSPESRLEGFGTDYRRGGGSAATTVRIAPAGLEGSQGIPDLPQAVAPHPPGLPQRFLG
jgi:serine/threonine protein kinase